MPSLWPQMMLVVSDVEASSRFYCDVIGLESGHGGDEYEQLLHQGELIMQLHDDDTHDHHGMLADDAVRGNGVLVWFEVADFDAAVERVRASGAPIRAEVHENPNAKQQEIWFDDPDGYRVVVSGPSAYRPR